ncbi:MAG: nucleotidyl transferase AbiEii/AbiGii toxin family protein [Fibrobacterota bacterium]
MDNPIEHVNAYASPRLQSLLSEVAAMPDISRDFFLTGGTALSVFFLHHRVSEDIDLFSTGNPDLPFIAVELSRKYGPRAVRIRQSEMSVFFLIDGIKLDLVKDPLSQKTERTLFPLETGGSISLDTLRNMMSNKLCASVGRREPKDYVDLFFLLNGRSCDEWMSVYADARNKDAIFDDAPSVAYQLESGFVYLKANPGLMPKLLVPFDLVKAEVFYKSICAFIYSMVKPG